MLNEDRLRSSLPVQGLGVELHFYPTVGSTNEVASELARRGAAHGTLVVAEEQSAGRGRAGRAWLTPPGSALALSLVLRPGKLSPGAAGGLSALGALAVAEAIDAQGGGAQIKWPNDVLLDGRKVAGVLVESSWVGEVLDHAVIGIGVNVRPASIPADREVDFPASCVESGVGRSIDRHDLLVRVLDGVGRWVGRLGSDALRLAWERRLAFLGERVWIEEDPAKPAWQGVIEGLVPDGRLRLRTDDGAAVLARPEGTHLRPVDRGAA
jgi:BirA family biotin operon repressor/biotin-[acetyl-CoA-carboxylase] ligase